MKKASGISETHFAVCDAVIRDFDDCEISFADRLSQVIVADTDRDTEFGGSSRGKRSTGREVARS